MCSAGYVAWQVDSSVKNQPDSLLVHNMYKIVFVLDIHIYHLALGIMCCVWDVITKVTVCVTEYMETLVQQRSVWCLSACYILARYCASWQQQAAPWFFQHHRHMRVTERQWTSWTTWSMWPVTGIMVQNSSTLNHNAVTTGTRNISKEVKGGRSVFLFIYLGGGALQVSPKHENTCASCTCTKCSTGHWRNDPKGKHRHRCCCLSSDLNWQSGGVQVCPLSL